MPPTTTAAPPMILHIHQGFAFSQRVPEGLTARPVDCGLMRRCFRRLFWPCTSAIAYRAVTAAGLEGQRGSTCFRRRLVGWAEVESVPVCMSVLRREYSWANGDDNVVGCSGHGKKTTRRGGSSRAQTLPKAKVRGEQVRGGGPTDVGFHNERADEYLSRKRKCR